MLALDIGTGTLMVQAALTVCGGAYAAWRFLLNQAKREAKIDRVLRQVEPNGGGSLRDDLTDLAADFKRFRTEIDRRLTRIEGRQ